jgi:hypothetical protein
MVNLVLYLLKNEKMDLISQCRKNILNILLNKDLDFVNQIPMGFNNNLLWHAGHIICVFDILAVQFSNQKSMLSETFINEFKKGSTPKVYTVEDKILIENLLIEQLNQFELSIDENNYQAYTTSFGNTIHNQEEALSFLLIHEGIHFGYILNILRFLNSNHDSNNS